MRPSFEETAMETARAWAKRSTCLRRAVGCVLLDARGRVLATGYNGVAAGLPHCNEETGTFDDGCSIRLIPQYAHACPGARAPSGTQLDACGAIHAEQNALIACTRPDDIAVAVATTAPCVHCAKMLLNTGCRRIVFAEDYPNSGRELWEAAGREWEKLRM